MSQVTMDPGTYNSAKVTLRLSDELLSQVSEQAHQARPGRALLSFIGGALFCLGWVVAKTFQVLFFAGAWAFAALNVGWRAGRGQAPRGPSLETLLIENDRLRKELARIAPTMS